MPRRLCLLLAGVLLLGGKTAQAQVDAPVEKDSLRSYDLAEIVVRGTEERRQTPNTVQRVTLAGITRADAAAVDEVLRLVPAAHVQTNSRGETLVYLRGAGERQVALFFDGALLNVPWDNRFDLALLPAGVVGGMTIAKGVPSVLYGANVLGGALNATSRTLANPGAFTDAAIRVGTAGFRQTLLTHLGRTKRLDYTVSVGYAARDGLALPADADLPFNQPDDDLRANTDRRMVNLFGRAGYRFGGAQLGLSVLHLDGEKGVAPEGHLDPERARVRFWRYPAWRTSMVILNGAAPLGISGGVVRGAVWGSRFAQTIEQFRSGGYDALQDEQEDEDYTVGARLTLTQSAPAGALRLALNALTSRHEQQDVAYETGAALPAPALTYRQHLFSVGAEYEGRPTPRLGLMLGGSLDGIATPETGDKPARDPQLDVGLTSGVTVDLSETWSLRASAGRKARFPTMRELFGEALNRFLLNPDLKPETSWLAEAGVGVQPAWGHAEVVAFFNRTFDTIDQRSVSAPGEERPRRQRVNLEGSRVYGLEAVGAAQPLRGWSVEGHLTGTVARAFEDGVTRRMVEKPAWLGTLTLAYNAPGGVSMMLQTVYTGRAYGLREDNTFEALPTSLVVHARAAYRLIRGRFSPEFFVRLNNATDAVTLPQLGLPGPGREVRAGVDMAF